MKLRKKIAIIGAGIAGVEAIRSFLAEDFEPVCFEKTGYVGGLWRYHEDDTEGIASVMKSTVINNSKELGAFSDFPPAPEYHNFMHNSKMYEYIKSYVESFRGTRFIKFHHDVMKVQKADDYEVTGRWIVTSRNTQTKEIQNEIFDGVAVCIGHHVYTNVPTFPGQNEFTGRIQHTHGLKNSNGFENLRVVVVGVGNSGLDAAVELSSVAKEVYISTRRGVWILPKAGLSGFPIDLAVIRRPVFLMLRYLPYRMFCTIFEFLMNKLHFDHEKFNLKPKHRILSQHPSFNAMMRIKLLSGAVLVRNNIKKFTQNGVIFEGEEDETPIDAVILATGYKVKFDFLSDDILQVDENRVKLYKYIFPPDLSHPTLAILGLVQPNGPALPLMEMQSRWASGVMNGKINLPTQEKMHASIKQIEEFNKKRFTDSPRHTFQVTYLDYVDELAEEIGAKPNLMKLVLTDPKLWLALSFGPALPYQYRLQGPHAWPGAREAILSFEKRKLVSLKNPGEKLRESKGKNKLLLIKMFVLLSLMWYLLRVIIRFWQSDINFMWNIY